MMVDQRKLKVTKGIEKGISPAGNFRRLINFLIDTIVIFICYFGVSLSIDGFISGRSEPFLVVFSFSLLGLVFFSYHYLMENRFQRTLGKMLTKTKVVTIDGQPPKSIDLALRTIIRLIPIDIVSYLFLREGLHDRISKTRVVRQVKPMAE